MFHKKKIIKIYHKVTSKLTQTVMKTCLLNFWIYKIDRLPFQWFKGSTMSLMLVKFKSSYEIINDALKHGSYIDCENWYKN